MKIKTAIEKKIVAGFAMSLLALLVFGAISYLTTKNLVATQDWVSHTHEVIATLESGLAILTDAETSQRAYLLTGDARFLDDCHQAEAKVGDWLEKTRQLTADNAAQQQRLEKLDALIAQRLALLNNRIILRQQQGLEAAAKAVASREGRDLMQQVWQGFAEMIGAEKQLLVQREKSSTASADQSLAVIVTGTVFACGLGLVALVLFHRDFKLRTQAEQRLLESRAQLQAISDNSPAVVFVKDLTGRYVFVNRRFEQIYGQPRQHIIGKTVHELFPAETARVADSHHQKILATQAPIEVEETVNYPDGPRPHLSLKFPLRDAAGEIYATSGISVDITERKRIEQMHLQFRSLFESLPGLYLVLKPDLIIVAVSDAYLKATMTTREKIMGQKLFDIFPDNPDDLAANGVSNLRASLNRVIQNGVADTMAIQKYDVRRPDGSFEERFWSPVNSPVFGMDGKIEYIVHRVEDVTEFVRRKKAATAGGPDLHAWMEQMEAEVFRSSQAVQAANQKLHAANDELEAFSYSVSHDLRAPLRHIDGFVKLLEKNSASSLDERGRRFLNIIGESAHQMGALIDDLLIFSRMGRTDLRRTGVEMNCLVHEALDALQTETKDRAIRWKIAGLPNAQADAAMLRQVWINLIANAVKYSRPRDPAEIEIGCAGSQNGETIFFVRDNGVGFDMEYADKLFGVFQRLHRADEFEGTGIGLANVRRIVSRHGGRTWAEGKVGTGATFYFSLPDTANPNEPKG